MTDDELTRRRLLELGLALPALGALAVGVEAPLAATPAIADDDEPTPPLAEGPYSTPRSPRRRSIVPAVAPGTPLTLTGRVLTTSGRPVARALVDFWQCDARGRYPLVTVVPGLYPGRTRHIHVKVQAPRRPALTTQLFFPGVAQNRSDSIFERACVVRGWRTAAGRRHARFDFVLDLG